MGTTRKSTSLAAMVANTLICCPLAGHSGPGLDELLFTPEDLELSLELFEGSGGPPSTPASGYGDLTGDSVLGGTRYAWINVDVVPESANCQESLLGSTCFPAERRSPWIVEHSSNWFR